MRLSSYQEPEQTYTTKAEAKAMPEFPEHMLCNDCKVELRHERTIETSNQLCSRLDMLQEQLKHMDTQNMLSNTQNAMRSKDQEIAELQQRVQTLHDTRNASRSNVDELRAKDQEIHVLQQRVQTLKRQNVAAPTQLPTRASIAARERMRTRASPGLRASQALDSASFASKWNLSSSF